MGMNSRRAFLAGATSLAASLPVRGMAQTGRVGVVLIHGKQAGPGGAMSALAGGLENAGAVTLQPEMPWSSSRYLSGTWPDAMAELAGAVQQIRGMGASKVFLAGHSMGCPAAMCYAAQYGGVAGIALIAAGHSPATYVKFTPEVRDSIETARAMVKAGRGAETSAFLDNNQGRFSTLNIPAAHYLSFFDPKGPAEMANTVGRVRCPALWVAGTEDMVIRWGDPIGRKLAGRPKSGYVTVPGANHVTTPRFAAPQITEWVMSI